MLSAQGAGPGSGPDGPVGEPRSAVDTAYGALESTLVRIGVPGAHRLGLTGAGIRVGLLDGAFRTGHEAFRESVVVASRDFVDEDDDVSPGPEDPPEVAARGTALWSLAGATATGLIVGPAFGASFILARTFSPDGTPRSDEVLWEAGLDWLESQGARIVLTGAGFRTFDDGFTYPLDALDGATAGPTIAAVRASGRSVLVVTPVGDLGPSESTLVVPSDGDGVLAVGAVDGATALAPFSSVGPTADGRSKPETLAPGVDVPAAGANTDLEILEVEGTGAAAALVAGASALFAEAHPSRTPSQIIEALEASARARTEPPRPAPLIDVGSAIAFPDGIRALPLEEVDGAGQVTTLTPLFQWDAPTIFPRALPISFTVLVASDSTFQDILLAERVVGTFARRLSRPLPPRREVYWRVNGETPQGITRKTNTEGPVLVPAWIELTVLNEPGGQTITETRPTFEWEPFEDLQPPAGPLVYDLTVFRDREETSVAAHSGLDTTALRLREPLPVNEPLRWSVVARTPEGQADTAISAGPFVVTSTSSPPATVLFQNFPNPFPQEAVAGRRDTRIWFDLAQEGPVDLTVYDLRGRLVRRLIPAAGCSQVTLPPGPYGRGDGTPDPCIQTTWDGRNDGGADVEPGVYLLRLRAGGTENIRRMVYWP